MIELQIRFFGSLRRYGSLSGPLRLQVEEPAGVHDIKTALMETLSKQVPNFSDSKIVAESALATERRMLGSEEKVSEPSVLLVLPPVCGG